jgi:hypothetical protein
LAASCNAEAIVNQEVLNASIRKFLKKLGVPSARSRRRCGRPWQSIHSRGNERFPAEATVTLGGVGLSLEIKGEIELE